MVRLCALLFLLTAPFAAVAQPPEVGAPVNCPYTSDMITVDGVLDEPAWENAQTVTFWLPISLREPVSQTVGRLCWTDDFLLVGIEAADRDLQARQTEHDSQTYLDDVLEIFVQPNPASTEYVNFEINALGTVYDAYERTLSRAWNSEGLQMAIQLHGTMNDMSDEDEGWTMEVAIPFSEIGFTPENGSDWKFHLSRYNYSAYLPIGRELSSCAPLSMVNFHHCPDWLTLHFTR